MGQCLYPWSKKGENITLPCGKCWECKARRVSGWSFRLMKEEEQSSSALFVTLTYSPESVPITTKGYMTLKKEDVQWFIHKLRKITDKKYKNEKTTIKYYACGEYGSHTFRPHYHIIIFGADPNLISKAWRRFNQESGKTEDIGTIHIGEVSGASIGYTLKYINKPSRIPIHKNDDRIKEFSLMSKRLGANYINEKTIKWHHADPVNRYYTPLKDGKKIALPRYYKQKLFTEEQRQNINEQINNQEVTRIRNLSVDKIVEEYEKNVYIRKEKTRKNNKDQRIQSKI